jgi:Na+-driven multidrug efflux pump
MTPPDPARRADVRDVVSTWWPLAASWLLMGLELPAVSAFVARLPDPRIHLAAYGGVVFPLALMIESPILMLLSASTALARDRASYHLIRRFMFLVAGSLTVLHALVAFTPLFDFVVVRLMGAPIEVREHARLGLQIMLPWTMAIAYRRTQQGVLIRFGHSRAVGIGTAVRLVTLVLVLGSGLAYGRLPGIVVATTAVTAGVVSEAIYAGFRVRPVLRTQVAAAPPVMPPLTNARFVRFYAPLSVTPLILFLAMPMSTATMSRMVRPLDSLAVWPVLNGLVFALRSAGFALNEVVVAMLERPGAVPALRRFTFALAGVVSSLLVLLAATPLGVLWLGRVSGLPPDLVHLSAMALWVALPMPALSAIQSYYQGALVHAHRTRGVTESVVIYLGAIAICLAAGGAWLAVPGIFVAFGAFVLANAVMVEWLRRRAKSVLRELERAGEAQAA